jgi:hypothetical protein
MEYQMADPRIVHDPWARERARQVALTHLLATALQRAIDQACVHQTWVPDDDEMFEAGYRAWLATEGPCSTG